MLAGVLLHVVEPARPVDRTLDAVPRHGRIEQVRDPVALIDDVDHRRRAEAPGVERLAAGGGVEGGAIEVDSSAVVAPLDHRGVEGGEVGVGVVEAAGHGWN